LLKNIMISSVLLTLTALPTIGNATMFAYMDANGQRHYVDIPNKKDKLTVLANKMGNARPKIKITGTTYTPIQISVAAVEPQTLDEFIKMAADNHKVDPLLIKAVIKTESNFDPGAVSPKGAQGLMQLMPGTARDLRVNNPFDPLQNITGGTKYLRQMLNTYNGDVRLSLAAYNAGPGRVTPLGMTSYIPETQAYVARVMERYDTYKQNN